ncbi:hypothetical protein AMTRI_Chr13g121090 [Amborella trichopoda]
MASFYPYCTGSLQVLSSSILQFFKLLCLSLSKQQLQSLLALAYAAVFLLGALWNHNTSTQQAIVERPSYKAVALTCSSFLLPIEKVQNDLSETANPISTNLALFVLPQSQTCFFLQEHL